MKSADLERLLRAEIATVVGCTEPAAIAHAVQAAKRYLRKPFDAYKARVTLRLSPELFRNASSAVVPMLNRKGIRAAVAAGLLSASTGFNPFADLKAPRAHPLLKRRSWLSVISSGRHGVYIRATLTAPGESVTAVVEGRHDAIARIVRNGRIVFRARRKPSFAIRSMEEVAAIVARGNARLESLAREFIVRQIKRDRLRPLPDRVAGLVTDRMIGRPLPVLTITGSGNQGILLGVPLFALYQTRGRRALPAVLFALLTQIYLSRLKRRISHECGLATKAAPALAAGLAYARGDALPVIKRVMTALGKRMGNPPCRGAQPGCGRKAARALMETRDILKEIPGTHITYWNLMFEK